jgi:hypothetical protein
VRSAAFEVLEGVSRDFYRAVRSLILDEQPVNHIEASKTLAQMGTRAAAAAPILLEHMRNPHPWRRGFIKAPRPLMWHSRVAPDIIIGDMIALARTSANDPVVLKAIIGVADFERYTIRFPNETGKEDFHFDARSLGMQALAEIAEEFPGLRKQIIPVFLRGLGQVDREPRLCFEAIRGLARCGPDAKDAALPALQKLKLSRFEAIREAVADAIAAVDPPKIAGGDVCGNVVGMVTAKILQDAAVESYGLARPADEIDQFLRKHLKGYKPNPVKAQELKWADMDALVSPAVRMILKVQ